MNKSEDYLEQLLKGAAPENDTLGEDAFEEDFLDEEFLKEFEMEMERMEASEGDGSDEEFESLFDDLDSILNGDKNQEVKDTVEEVTPVAPEESEDSFEESEVNFADLFAAEEKTEDTVEAPVAEEGFSFADLFANDITESKEETPQEDPDVLKILEGLEGIDLELDEVDMNQGADNQNDFSALEGFLAASAAATSEADTGVSDDISLDTLGFGDNAESDSTEPVEESGKKEKKKKNAGEKSGFMNKLGLILFGEDDGEDDTAKAVVIGEASEADLEGLADVTEKAKKEQKKKEQKEKREQAKQARKEKQEKAKQEKEKKKQAKPKKEKKPKPPKQPDNTPPLPKKPVFLIFVMVASLLALILIGADLLGYSNQMNNAKAQYAKKNYSEAFAEISGIEIKEEDVEIYNKYHVMAMVSTELEAYESLMSKGFYDMALDCLVRTIGRAEKYSVDAELYGCSNEMHELEQRAETILDETFGLSREDALEFYAYRSKKEYSIALAKVIKELDLEKVTE